MITLMTPMPVGPETITQRQPVAVLAGPSGGRARAILLGYCWRTSPV
jgi:hypothetical protein